MRNEAAALAVACIAIFTTSAPGRADFDAPKKAVSAKATLVRAFAPCTTPNDVHSGIAVLPACSPATPLSTYTFGPAGKGSVQVQRKGFTFKLRLEVNDVRTAADQPVDHVTFRGRVAFRITDNACSGNACTFETFVTLNMPCLAGRCFASVVWPEQYLPYSGLASVEITQLDVMDDDDDRFATSGIFVQ